MKRSLLWVVMSLMLGLVLAACNRGGGGIEVTTGSISGAVLRVEPLSVADLAPAAASARPAAIEPGGVFVAFAGGRPEVQFGANSVADGFTFRQNGDFGFAGVEFRQTRAYPTRSGLAFYQADGLSEAATRDLVDSLRASSAVEAAFPNWILEAQATPTDPFYDFQAWHYEQFNLPAAWDIEDGSSLRITVGVLDSGSFTHPDIEWGVGANLLNWGAGYVGPIEDPSQEPGGSSHGTHVAGTIGATTNNGVGVAGVNWDVEILPIKVLGATGSGSFSGILEGIYWAAGDDIPAYGGHVNSNPARVINLSLGGNIYEPCPPAYDAIFQEVYAMAGTIAVVAAGNDASPTDIFFPANCPSVITVGATGPTAERAYYSNFGAYVDVFAPGGDFDYDHPFDDDFGAGVLSTVEGDYDFYQGTSMASPHVAGLVSLILAQDPDLSLDEVRERLHNASVPMSYGECWAPVLGFDGQNLCGAGLLDAEAALLGVTLTTPRAFVYAIPVGDTLPDIGLAQLASLSALATYQVEADAEAAGEFSFSIEDLEAGSYLVLALELRDPDNGVANVDRVGFAVAEVVAGADSEVTVVVDPIYLSLW